MNVDLNELLDRVLVVGLYYCFSKATIKYCMRKTILSDDGILFELTNIIIIIIIRLEFYFKLLNTNLCNVQNEYFNGFIVLVFVILGYFFSYVGEKLL